MKNLMWIIVAALVAGVIYLLYTGQSPEQAVKDISGTGDVPAAVSTETPAEGTVTEEAKEAVEDAAKAASDAAEKAGDAVKDAATATGEAVDSAVSTATEAASDTANAVKDAATDAANAVTGATATTQEAATGTDAEATEQTATDDDMEPTKEELLTVEGFDLAKVSEMIDTSSMADTEKALLKSALADAQNDPVKLKNELEKLRAALNL